SYTIEALTRSGIGSLHLIYCDNIALSNLNRQLITNQNNIGCNKTEESEKRLSSINPNLKIKKHNLFFNNDSINEIPFSKIDYIVDAIDTVTSKILLIEIAKKNNIPILSLMGAGNKLDATAFKVADISKTSVCPLARVMRYELKKRNIKNVKVVFSDETPLIPIQTDEVTTNTFFKKRQTPGSVAFVTGVAGLIAAGEVVKDLCK
ncbi:MAG: tRNA threonylcarbamoyladenosine dehydratase, partial [Oscillospiraceae bacterium]